MIWILSFIIPPWWDIGAALKRIAGGVSVFTKLAPEWNIICLSRKTSSLYVESWCSGWRPLDWFRSWIVNPVEAWLWNTLSVYSRQPMFRSECNHLLEFCNLSTPPTHSFVRCFFGLNPRVVAKNYLWFTIRHYEGMKLQELVRWGDKISVQQVRFVMVPKK